ncbi:hypothetical protein N7526_002203 [Penicillium atrosanguineum]|nr:hypothetical protein N7526_002203 [Penicillium atrosanguineum]
MDPKLALVHGSKEPVLWAETLGNFIDKQAAQYEDRPAVIFPWQSVRLSYRQLAGRSNILAKSMLEMGLCKGDCIGIMAGNCYQYIEVFLGGGRIGCPVVVLNNTYTPEELMNAVQKSSHIKALRGDQLTNPALPELRRLVSLGHMGIGSPGVEMQSYSTFTSGVQSVFMKDSMLLRAEKSVNPEDVLNLQFTSGITFQLFQKLSPSDPLIGTTGSPKAAMLTHK